MTISKLITPIDPLCDDEFFTLVNELSAVYLQKAISLCDNPPNTCIGVLEDLIDFLSTKIFENMTWRPEVTLAVFGDKFTKQGRLAQILLAANALGFSRDWSLQLDQPQYLLFCSKTIKVNRGISVVCSDTFIKVTSDGMDYRFARFSKSPVSENMGNLKSASSLDIGNGKAFCDAGFWEIDAYTPCENTKSVTTTLDETMRVFTKLGGPYLNWYSRVLSCVLPLGWNPGPQRLSSTSPLVAGVSAFSFPIDPFELGEAIAHETAHQYFYIIVKIAKLYDRSDTQMFRSPLVRNEKRSLKLMFVAYHAIVNMALYRFRLLELNLGDEQKNLAELNHHFSMIGEYEKAFSSSSGMLSNGKLFWDVQKEALERIQL